MKPNIISTYQPSEHEAEKASNSYLMSLIAVIAGMPFPILNLMATLFFWLGNRKGTYFVRWHCTQALMSQLTIFCMNTIAFWWTIGIIFGDNYLNNYYISYVLTIFIFNVFEFFGTLVSAIQSRKGIHMNWWFFSDLTTQICKP